MRVRLGLMVVVIAVLAAACYTPFDFDGSGRTNLVWWNDDAHQWQQYDPAQPTTPTVLATGTSSDSEGWAGDYDGDGRYDLGIREKQPWLPAFINWPGGSVAQTSPAHRPGVAWTGTCNCAGTENAMIEFGAYDGGHRTIPGYYQVVDATWTIEGHAPFTFGRPKHTGGLPDWDLPVPGDYDGDGTTEVAVYNPITGDWTARRNEQPVLIGTFGGHGAFPIPADWDGDGTTDPAYFTSNEVHVLDGPTYTLPAGFFDGGTPILGDYDGDGRIEPGVLRGDSAQLDNKLWITTVHDGAGVRVDQTISMGNSTPAPFMSTVGINTERARLSYLAQCWSGGTNCLAPYDFDGSGRTNLTWWSDATHQWKQYDPAIPSTPTIRATGAAGSTGLGGDFDGDGRYDLGIAEPSQPGTPATISFPGGSVPLNQPTTNPPSPWTGSCPCNTTHPVLVFGAYDGGHKTLPSWYQSQDATWTIAGHAPFTFGRAQHASGLPDWDVPVPADYDGDGHTDVAVYNPVNGDWTVRRNGLPVVIATFGGNGAFPLPADWDGDGKADPAYVTGTEIHVYGKATIALPFGPSGFDAPIVGDFDGDGRTELSALNTGGGGGTHSWVTTVHNGTGPTAPLGIGQTLSIGDGTPAPSLDTMALITDIARLTYLRSCLAHPGTC